MLPPSTTDVTFGVAFRPTAAVGAAVLLELFGRRTLFASPVPDGVLLSTCVLTAESGGSRHEDPGQGSESARAALVFKDHSRGRRKDCFWDVRHRQASPSVLDLLQMRQHCLFWVSGMFGDVPEQ